MSLEEMKQVWCPEHQSLNIMEQQNTKSISGLNMPALILFHDPAPVKKTVKVSISRGRRLKDIAWKRVRLKHLKTFIYKHGSHRERKGGREAGVWREG